jgi:hypothetical protein
MLRTLQQIADDIRRAGDDDLRERVGLALLDAIHLGDQMGWLDIDEADQRVPGPAAGLTGPRRRV